MTMKIFAIYMLFLTVEEVEPFLLEMGIDLAHAVTIIYGIYKLRL